MNSASSTYEKQWENSEIICFDAFVVIIQLAVIFFESILIKYFCICTISNDLTILHRCLIFSTLSKMVILILFIFSLTSANGSRGLVLV